MKKRLSLSHPFQNGHILLFIVCVSLFLTLSACNLPFSSKTSTNTAATPRPTSKPTPSPTPTPSIKLGTQSCPSTVSSPNYWNPIIPTQTNINKVESISCGNLLGKTALQALVTVRNNGASATLDVYVYDNILNSPPTKIFSLQNLVKGSAKISTYNTVLTSQIDPHAIQSHSTASATNLNSEFKWSDSAGTLVPITFPGIFPTMDRYQAENDQQMVNQGQNAWMLSPTQVALNFVTNPLLLKWSSGSVPTITSGGGQHDVNAVVTVKNAAPGNHTVQLTMSRLEGNANGGIWIITGVNSPGLSLTTPTNLEQVSSPVTITGTGTAFEGVVGSSSVLDSHYNRLGQTSVKGTHGNGQTTFSASLPYNETFQTGKEEGLVAIYAISNTDGSIAGATMVKTLLSYSA